MTYNNAEKYVLKGSCPKGRPTNERLEMLLSLFDNPHNKLQYVRLVGSNGKSICAEMMQNILIRTKLRVGCLKLPLSGDVRNAITFDGKSISMEDFLTITREVYKMEKDIQKALEDKIESPILPKIAKNLKALINAKNPISANRYELILLIALIYFKRKNCNFCIIETHNSSYDPSLILPAPISTVICGSIPEEDNELDRIKTYIRRGSGILVCGPQTNKTYMAISEECFATKSRLIFPDVLSIDSTRNLKSTNFTYKGNNYTLGLIGKFEIINACIVIEAIEVISKSVKKIFQKDIEEALSTLKIPTKFELLAYAPTIIADSTHDKCAIETICLSLHDLVCHTGNKINLCVSPALIPLYSHHLKNMGYDIQNIFVVKKLTHEEYNLDDIDVTYFTNEVKCAKHILNNTQKDELVFISGTYEYAHALRCEILRQLTF